jgi:hypothetical protein
MDSATITLSGPSCLAVKKGRLSPWCLNGVARNVFRIADRLVSGAKFSLVEMLRITGLPSLAFNSGLRDKGWAFISSTIKYGLFGR